jgi:hypothetical protein
MTRSSRRVAWRAAVPHVLAAQLGLAAALALVAPDRVMAQERRDPAALRAEIERRFDALPLREGIALRPKSASSVRSIEITDGAIAIDGQPVTGAELRTRLGADADLILQLSYLDDAQRRALLDRTTPPTAPKPPSSTGTVPPEPPRSSESRRRSRFEHRSGDRVRFGGSVTVDEGESVDGDVVVIGGSAHVNGEVTGDVVVVGGRLDLGPHADIRQDAVVVGGAMRRDPGARIGGSVQEVGVGQMNFDWLRGRRGTPFMWWRSGVGPLFDIVASVIRVAVICLLAALVVLFGRAYVDRIGAHAAAEPLKAGAVGLLAQLLFLPLLVVTIVLFVVTIVGIPLLLLIPFGVLALMVFAFVGFTAIASFLGRWLTVRFGWTDRGPIVTTIIGVLFIVSPLLLGRLVGLAGGPLSLMSMALAMAGLCAEYLAWTVGFGAVALARFGGALPATGSGGTMAVPTGSGDVANA